MMKTKLTDDVYLYQFPPMSENLWYGFNIYALVNGPGVLLIDAGHDEQSTAVQDDLRARGRQVHSVLISHFHEDHYLGVRTMTDAPVLGSARYAATFAEHPPDGGPAPFLPTILLEDGSSFHFGRHTLRFLATPGHSACSLCTIINDSFLHVADNLMATNDGDPVLPWADLAEFPNLARSLRLIRALSELTLLPGHGAIIDGGDAVKREVDLRLDYLETVISSCVPPTYAEVVEGCARGFKHAEWHNHHIGVV